MWFVKGWLDVNLGLDTSVLVRLLTGQPAADYEYCVRRLRALNEQGVRVLASNQVIGESYVTAQHHYGFSDLDIRTALLSVLRGKLVVPLNGQAVLDAIQAPTANPGLFDRLITDGYTQVGLETLTLDRRMARLQNARLL